MPINGNEQGQDRGKHAYDGMHGINANKGRKSPHKLRIPKGHMPRGHKKHGSSPRKTGRSF